MRFNGRSDPSSITSKSLSSLPPVKTKKKKSPIDHVPDKKQPLTNINAASRKSTSENGKNKVPIIPRPTKLPVGSFDEQYDVEFDKQFSEERLSDENECMWLSSDCSSPSSFFDQYSSPESDRLVDEWLGRAFLSSSHVKDEEEDHQEAETWLFSPLENETTSSTSCDELDGVTLMLSLVDLDEQHSKEHALSTETPAGGGSEYDCGDDEPIFWPFKSKFNCGAEESMKYFCMSPRKNNVLDRSKTLDLRGDGCRRRLEFGDRNFLSLKGKISSPKKSLVEESGLDTGNSNNLWRNNTMPSRLSASTKSRTLQDLLILEDHEDLLTVYGDDYNEESPIEKLVGLGEFDGHEGVDSDFNRDSFSLDGSFRML